MSTPVPPLKGKERFNAPPAKLYAELTNLDALAANIPDLQSSQKVDDRTLQCVVKPGFSFIRGTMKTRIHLAETTPDQRVVMKVSASGIGMGMEIESRLNILPEDGGAASTLDWEAAVVGRSGLLSLVGPSLIQGAAEKTIRDGWEKLRARVE
jgi:carbon monoxide dehydrogenase subunit G